MFDWYRSHGYQADLARVREIHPAVRTLQQWLDDTRWMRADAG